jgi:integrase/recombinase XerD
VSTRGGDTTLPVAVAGYLDHLRVERGLALNTLVSYERDLARYTEFCAARGIEGVAAVHESDVAAFLVELRQGSEHRSALSASSAGRTLVAVRGLHRFALMERWVEVDVAAEVRPPRPDKRLPKAIPLEDVERMLEAAAALDAPLGPRDLALLEILYGTGARISEAVGLDVDDIDHEHGAVLLRGKGGKERLVPIGSHAREAVQAYLVRSRPVLGARGPGGPALLRNSRGGRLSRQSAWTVLRAAAGRAGLSAAVSPHTLRHSYATHLLDGGADVRVVQELLGHASVTTTQVYTMVTVERLREVYAESHPRARG